MEIKIELKPMKDKLFEDLEKAISSAISKLSEYEKMVLKHKIMDIKKSCDGVEFEIKNLTNELNKVTEEETVEPKPVEKKVEVKQEEKPEPEEIEL
jgi:phenylalanyl-tRNA synthetase alpha subunit